LAERGLRGSDFLVVRVGMQLFPRLLLQGYWPELTPTCA
jgi:hypothetical protein